MFRRGVTQANTRAARTAGLRQEAAAWALRLRDADVSVEEFAEWQQWLSQSEEHSRTYLEMEETIGLAGRADLSGLWPDEEDLAADSYAGEVPVAEYIAEMEQGSVSAFVRRRWLLPAGALAAGHTPCA